MKDNRKQTYIDTNFLVVSTKTDGYKFFDQRSMKPVILKDQNTSLILERLAPIKTKKYKNKVKYHQIL